MPKKPRIKPTKRGLNCEDIWFDLVLTFDVPTPYDSKKYDELYTQLVEERRQQWEVCRDWVMEKWMNSRDYPGRRPHCWWVFDSGEGALGIFENEPDCLRRLGLLETWEIEELARFDQIARTSDYPSEEEEPGFLTTAFRREGYGETDLNF